MLCDHLKREIQKKQDKKIMFIFTNNIQLLLNFEKNFLLSYTLKVRLKAYIMLSYFMYVQM